MKKKISALLLTLFLLMAGPLNTCFVVITQALSAPNFVIDEISNDGSTLVASLRLESGSFSALNLKFAMSGLECVSIVHGETLTEAENSEEDTITVTDSVNKNETAEGKSNISFACTPEYELAGELYRLTFNVTSLADYSFDVQCLKCYQYLDGKYKKVTPLITSKVSYDQTTFDKTTYLKYSINNGEATITGCNTSIFYKFEIPAEFKGYPVKYIGDNAFKGCALLTEITIPSSVVKIGYGAFYNCGKLEKINFSESVKEIGQSAFYGTAYYNNGDNWEENVLYLNNCLIKYNVNNYSSYNVKDGTVLLADYAFADKNITKLSLPNSLKYIGDYCFDGCHSLKYFCPQDEKIFETEIETLPTTASPEMETTTEMPTRAPVEETTTTEFVEETRIVQKQEESKVTEYKPKLPNGVETIGDFAFCDCSNLTSITIPKTVTSIGERAFAGCTRITEFEVASDNKNYSNDNHGCLFNNNRSYLIQFPVGSQESNYNIPDAVCEIAPYAFAGCENLTDIRIPEGVTKIGESAFWHCCSLEKLTYNAISANYYGTGSSSPFYGLSSLKNVEVGENVKALPSYFMYGCSGLETITLPKDLTAIGNYAFVSCTGMTEFIIPENVTLIGRNAFASCTGLTEITIPKNVIGISVNAFYNCTSLKRLNYNAISADFGGTGSDSPFYGLSSLENVKIGKDVVELPNYFLCGCGVYSVEIPNSVKTINNYAFSGCTRLCYAVLGSKITKIGSYAFYNTALNHVFYSGNDEQRAAISIGGSNSPLNNAIWHTGVAEGTELFSTVNTVPPTCSSTGYTTYCCAICSEEFNGRTVAIDPNAHKYTDGVCEHCSMKKPIDIVLDSFETVKIDNSGEIIKLKFVPETSGTYYFYSDSNYDTRGYIYNNRMSSLTSNDDGGVGNNFCVSYSMTAGTVYYLGARFYSSSVGTFAVSVSKSYSSASAHDFEVTVTQADCLTNGETKKICKNCNYSTTEVAEYAGHSYENGVCTKCGWIEGLSYSISNGNVTITDYTGNLTDLKIPAKLCNYPVVKIGDDAFEYCTGLTSVTIGNSVTSIGDWAFSGCTGLTSITIPDSVTSIGSSAFYDCTGLTSVNYTGTREDWCRIKFDGWGSNPVCYSECLYINGEDVGNVVVPDDVTEISEYAFCQCKNLTSITIPDSVTSIGSDAFYNCKNLTSITIPDSVTNIGSCAFYNCDYLEDFFYAGSQSQWDEIEISDYGNYYFDKTIQSAYNGFRLKKPYRKETKIHIDNPPEYF